MDRLGDLSFWGEALQSIGCSIADFSDDEIQEAFKATARILIADGSVEFVRAFAALLKKAHSRRAHAA